jgi:hypothetical protein
MGAWRVTIPKPGGGERPLGIPTIRGRVVQTDVDNSTPVRCRSVSVPSANPFMPSQTPANGSARVADGGSGHADTLNPHPPRAASFTHGNDHVVRLLEGNWQHSLRR